MNASRRPNEGIDTLTLALRARPQAVSTQDLRRLYELIGLSMQHQHGVAASTNPCSVPTISAVVLKMAEQVEPCRLRDVGMGGYPFVDMELERRGFTVTGVEYSHALSSLAEGVCRRHGSGIRCIQADGTSLPFADGSFDACVCSETLEHVPDDRAIIGEIHRVLRPGGTLLLTVPSILSLLGLGRRLFEFARRKTLIVHPTHLREDTIFSARRLFIPYFSVACWLAVPFTLDPFRKMPYEKILNGLVRFPPMKQFSASLAFVLRRREDGRSLP